MSENFGFRLTRRERTLCHAEASTRLGETLGISRGKASLEMENDDQSLSGGGTLPEFVPATPKHKETPKRVLEG